MYSNYQSRFLLLQQFAKTDPAIPIETILPKNPPQYYQKFSDVSCYLIFANDVYYSYKLYDFTTAEELASDLLPNIKERGEFMWKEDEERRRFLEFQIKNGNGLVCSAYKPTEFVKLSEETRIKIKNYLIRNDKYF